MCHLPNNISYSTVENGLFRDTSTECYLRGFSILLISLEAFFTSGDFILYCYDSVQLAIARENFDFEGDVGLFNQRLYVLRCLIPSI